MVIWSMQQIRYAAKRHDRACGFISYCYFCCCCRMDCHIAMQRPYAIEREKRKQTEKSRLMCKRDRTKKKKTNNILMHRVRKHEGKEYKIKQNRTI